MVRGFIALLIVVKLLFPFGVDARGFPYIQYKTLDGLPSNTVYNIEQDNEGYIWIGTANGLSKFDGHRFINFSTVDGLNSNSITSLSKGNGSSMFIGNYSNGLNKYYFGKLSEIITRPSRDNITEISSVGDTTLLLYYANCCYFNVYKISHDGTGRYMLYRSIPALSKKFRQNDTLCYHIHQDTLFRLDLKTLSQQFVGYIRRGKPMYSVTQTSKGTVLVGSTGVIYEFNKHRWPTDSLVLPIFLKGKVSRVITDGLGQVWFYVGGKGLYVFDKNKRLIDITSYLQISNVFVTQLLRDKDGNIWVTTNGKGVYYFHDLWFTNYSAVDGIVNANINSINKTIDDNIICGTWNGASLISDNRVVKNFCKGRYIYKIEKNKDGSINICGTVNHRNRYQIAPGIWYLQGCCSYDRNDSCKLLGGYGTVSISDDWGSPPHKYIDVKCKERKRIEKIVCTPGGKIWMGCRNGMFSSMIGDTIMMFVDINSKSREYIHDILYDTITNRLWTATESGVFYMKNERWYTFSCGDINFEHAQAITIDNAQQLWIGTVNGLYCVTQHALVFNYFGRYSALSSPNVQALYYDADKDNLWVGTDDGLSVLDVSLLYQQKRVRPYIKLLSIQAADSIYSSTDNIVLPYTRNSLSIIFSCLYFPEPESIQYEYWLNDTENIYTSVSPVINFSKLPSGDYTLYLRAKNEVITSDITMFHFKITPPFWDTILFKFIVTIIVLCGGYLLYRNWATAIQRKASEKNHLNAQILALKQQALAASLNPHFISNALNAIQYFINSNDLYTANEYFSKFSRLIRLHLDHASDPYIILTEEIRRLELYIALEQLRFRGMLNYEINIANNVLPGDILIPNMLLQPFIENAIWHGILPKKDKGNIQIEIKLNLAQDLIIVISDDGIGIENAKKNKQKNHTSHGMRIIIDRLKMLNATPGYTPIIIKDIRQLNPTKTGTQVTIVLTSSVYSAGAGLHV